MVRYDKDDPLGAKTVARPDTSGRGAPPPPVEYMDPFNPPAMEEGTKKPGFGKILGTNEVYFVRFINLLGIGWKQF